MTRKLVAIVPAAGVGQRARATVRSPTSGLDPAGARLLGGAQQAVLPKQYRLLHGEPMLRWTVRALLADSRIEQVRVIAAAGDERAEQSVKGLPRVAVRFCGGPTRADTVAAALHDASFDDDTWVLVHDAARPGLPLKALARLIDICLECGRGGLLAMPVADTVKQARQPTSRSHAAPPDAVLPDTLPLAACVAHTVPRAGLWQAQTPQMFTAAALLTALHDAKDAGTDITDEAFAMELAGHAPILVPGSLRNFKVTWPGDFDLMEKWLQ